MAGKEVVGAATVIGGGGSGYGAYKFFGDFNNVAKKLQDEKFELLDTDISNKEGINYKIWKFLTLSYSRHENTDEKISTLSITIIDPDDQNLNSAIEGLISKCRSILGTSFNNPSFSDLKSKAEKWCVGNVGTKWIKDGGVPIIFAKDRDTYWNRAYDRYYLEVEDKDKLPNSGDKKDRETGQIDEAKKKNLEKDCDKFLLSRDLEGDKYQAGKWCFQYTAVKDSTGGSKLKTFSDKNEWSQKYDWNVSASTDIDQNLKALLTTLMSSSIYSGKNQEEKKAHVLHDWCTRALNGSSTKTVQVMKACPFNDK